MSTAKPSLFSSVDKFVEYLQSIGTERMLKKEGISDLGKLVKNIFELIGRMTMDNEISDNESGALSSLYVIPFYGELMHISEGAYYGIISLMRNRKPKFVNIFVRQSEDGTHEIKLRLEYDEGIKSDSYIVKNITRKALRESLDESIHFLEAKGYRIGLSM